MTQAGPAKAGHYVLMCALLLIPAAPALADHVALTNGDGLTGHIASTSSAELIIDTDLAGRVTIPWTAVSKVTPATAVPAGVRLGAAGASQPSSSSTWHGTVNAGIDVSHGNTETRGISTNGTVTRLGPRDRVGMFVTHLSSSIGSGADAVTTARATRGGMRYDHDLQKTLYAFGFFDAENDLLQLLDLRTVAGAGAGAHLFKSDMTQVNLFGGVSYARDNYTEVTTTDTSTTTTTTTGTAPGGPPPTTPGKGGTPPGQGGTPPGQTRVSRGGTPPDVVRTSLNRNVGEFLIGQDLTRQLSGNVGVSEALTVFPAVSDLADYRVSFDFTLWAQLNGWLQWNASVADRYLHIPPAGGAVQNDTFVWTGLGITFGRGDSGAYTGADGRRTSRGR